MALSFLDFISQAMAQPSLFVILILVIGVTAVSGATDAPNAIATVVSTRCLKPSVAIGLAAVFNFVGLVGLPYFSPAVAKTMFGMVDFSGNTDAALYALMAAMIGAILWGIFCWFFGIPCSKSHSLIAGVTGGAIALNGLAGVVPAEWAKVIYGMVFSLVAGFFLGWLFVKVIEKACTHVNRQAANHAFTGIQDVCAVALSFLHGAQDGQKFMSIFMLAIMMTAGMGMDLSGVAMPMWLMIFCAFNMGLGTAVGGERIIKSVGMDMVKLEAFQGFAASLSTFVSLMLATFGGLPVSTTHTNTTAIMGVGAAKNPKSVKWSIAIDMVKTWVLTFPGCGILGFACAKLFLMIL